MCICVFLFFCNCVFVCFCICAILHLCIIVKQRTGQTVWRRWVAGSAPRSLPRDSGAGAARHTTRLELESRIHKQDTTRHTARHPGEEHLLNTPRPESIFTPSIKKHLVKSRSSGIQILIQNQPLAACDIIYFGMRSSKTSDSLLMTCSTCRPRQ